MNREWRNFWDNFWEGERGAGETRSEAMFVTVVCVALLGRLILAVDATQFTSLLLEYFPAAGQIVPRSLWTLVLSFFTAEALRAWIPPIAAVLVGMTFAALYLQDIFEFPSFERAYQYLEASLFGHGYPLLTIRNGQKEVVTNVYNPLDVIGGPGWLDIRLSNAVVLERGAGPTSVLGAGWHFIRRFESIRAIIDLRETYRARAEIKVMTRDGIELILRNVEATFRIDTGKQPKRTELNPYPFSVHAVRDAVYNRGVEANGELEDWSERVMGLIVGQVTDWIATQRLDRLTAATAQDPRAAIRQLFDRSTARLALARLGAELIWINIGHIDTPADVDAQRAESWQSFWQGQNAVTEAHGEALRLQYAERGRAEGQAEMLRQIAQALEGAPANALPPERIYELLLMRISHVLESMPEKEAGASNAALAQLLRSGGPRALPPGAR